MTNLLEAELTEEWPINDLLFRRVTLWPHPSLLLLFLKHISNLKTLVTLRQIKLVKQKQTCVILCYCQWPETEMENSDWTNLLMKQAWLHKHLMTWLIRIKHDITWLALSQMNIEESALFRSAWWGFCIMEMNANTYYRFKQSCK